jgi:LysR family transcriptional regulator, regulator for bpeEF and oprC
MLDPSQLSAFVSVVRTGSFTRAADAVGGDKAHVSRLVSRLEATLGVQLLVRSTRSLSVTEMGREVYERAVGVLTAIEETEAAAANAQRAPSGTLRLTCGEEFGQFVVSKWIISYQRRFPSMRIDAYLTNRVVDVIHEGFDLAIRVGELPDSSLTARKLGTIEYALYASPGYLKKTGKPRSAAALADRDIVLSTGGGTRSLVLQHGSDRVEIGAPPRLAVNNNALALALVCEGFGIGLLPRFMAASFVASKQLLPVLESWTRSPVPVHAVYASSRFLTPKVRAFIDLAGAAFDDSLRQAG